MGANEPGCTRCCRDPTSRVLGSGGGHAINCRSLRQVQGATLQRAAEACTLHTHGDGRQIFGAIPQAQLTHPAGSPAQRVGEFFTLHPTRLRCSRLRRSRRPLDRRELRLFKYRSGDARRGRNLLRNRHALGTLPLSAVRPDPPVSTETILDKKCLSTTSLLLLSYHC